MISRGTGKLRETGSSCTCKLIMSPFETLYLIFIGALATRMKRTTAMMMKMRMKMMKFLMTTAIQSNTGMRSARI